MILNLGFSVLHNLMRFWNRSWIFIKFSKICFLLFICVILTRHFDDGVISEQLPGNVSGYLRLCTLHQVGQIQRSKATIRRPSFWNFCFGFLLSQHHTMMILILHYNCFILLFFNEHIKKKI